MATDAALNDLLVLDLTDGIAGAYTGKLLADLGARVIMIEPPDGVALRRHPPLADDAPYGGLFAHLSGGKESLIPSDGDDAQHLLDRILRRADVLLTDQSSAWSDALPGTLPDRVVRVDLSAWGDDGPYAGWRGSDIATWAMGGYMFFTGEPDREPLMLPGGQSQLHAGVHAALAALAALRERRRSGRGQRIAVSQLEANLSAHAWLVSSWIASGQPLPRSGHDFTRTADGWAHFMQMVPNPNIFLLIDQPERIDSVDLTSIDAWRESLSDTYRDVEAWAQDHTALEVATLAQELRIACTPVLDAAGLDQNEQLAARGWWETGDDPVYGDSRFPGSAYQLSRTPAQRPGPAPLLGEHSDALRREFADTPRPAPPPAVGTAAPPLEGLRVLELTANWAGPIAGRHLGDLGADVIKLEWAARPATRALFMPGPTQDPQRYPYDRAMYFNGLNRNKRDLIADLGTERGKDLFRQLIAQSDVFIENNSARVMPNLGLDYDAMRQVNPRLIYVSMSGFGASGPWRDWGAYGSNIEASSGLASVTGYDPSQVYRTPLFYADPVSGNHAAVAILAALEERERSGEGQFIDIALNEAGAAYFCDMLMRYQTSGEIARPDGNRDPRFAPQGAYPCAGEDAWLALSVQNDADWQSLCELIDRPDLASNDDLAHLPGRRARHDEIDAAVSAWTSQYEQYEAARALQAANISAAPILANWQILSDPHIHQRRFYEWVDHPVVGVYPYPTWPWRFSRSQPSIRRPAPRFAEHNREILSELGLSPDEIAALYEAGVTSDTPTAPLLMMRGNLSDSDD